MRQGPLPLPACGERARVRGNPRRYISPKIPFSARALHRQLQPLELALDGPVDHPRSELFDEAADQPPVDLDLESNPASDAASQLLAQVTELSFAQGLRGGDLCGNFAAPLGEFHEVGLDHCWDGKETAAFRDDSKEIADQPGGV